MSFQCAALSVLRKRPMRRARITVPEAAGLTQRAWPSSMPSISLSLTMRLLRCGRSESFTRSALQSFQVPPPSRLRMAPPTSSAA